MMSKKRCTHAHIVIQEVGTAFTNHVRTEDGWIHESDVGDYTGRLHVQCYDCGYSNVYWRFAKKHPKWLREALNELGLYKGSTVC